MEDSEYSHNLEKVSKANEVKQEAPQNDEPKSLGAD